MTDAWNDQTEVTRISGGMINAESIYVGGITTRKIDSGGMTLGSVNVEFDTIAVNAIADAVIEEIRARYPGILDRLQEAE